MEKQQLEIYTKEDVGDEEKKVEESKEKESKKQRTIGVNDACYNDLERFKEYVTNYLGRKRINWSEFLIMLVDCMKKKLLKVEVDDREPEEIFNEFDKLQFAYLKKRLEVGDVVFGDLVIERKEIKDYVSSLFDGRLKSQVERMKDFKKKFIIVVGNLIELDRVENLNPILANMASIGVRSGVNILAVDDNLQYCKLVKYIIEKYKDEMIKPKK